MGSGFNGCIDLTAAPAKNWQFAIDGQRKIAAQAKAMWPKDLQDRVRTVRSPKKLLEGLGS